MAPKKYFTLRLDDCTMQDSRIIEIFERYGFTGCTFYMNTGLFGHDWSAFVGSPHVRYSREEAERVYRGQDVQVHTVSHFALNTLPDPQITAEVNLDAENIRAMFGHTPVGLSWPGGDRDWDAHTLDVVLATTDMRYGSCTTRTGNFDLPTRFMTWYPTCAFSDGDSLSLLQAFIEAKPTEDMLFKAWGHGYEPDSGNTWDRFEEMIRMICEAAKKDDSIEILTNSAFFERFKDRIPS